MNIDETTVTAFLSALKKKYPDLKIVPFGEVGESFRKEHPDNRQLHYEFVHQGIGFGGSLENVRLYWYLNKYFLPLHSGGYSTGHEKSHRLYGLYQTGRPNPKIRIIALEKFREIGSLLGDINQKGLREQDKPIDFVRLSEAQKELIGRAEKEFGFTVTF